MGNESSNDNKNNTLQDLQRQILENQIKMQNIQIQNLQKQNLQNQNLQNQNQNQNLNSYNNNSINLKSLLTHPELQEKLKEDPHLKEQVLNKILNNYNNQLTHQQIIKIKSLLGFNDELSNQYLTNQGTIDYNKNDQQKQQELEIQRKKIEQYEQQKRIQKQEFLKRQNQRKIEYEQKLQELNEQNINAMRLFKLQEGFTLEQLKRSYKKLAVQTHPDRPKGSKEKFQVVTKCYFKLLEKLKTEEVQPDFNELKNNANNYYQEREELNKNHDSDLSKQSNSRFNVKQFNKIFEQNKLYDPNEEGYDEWLKNDNNECAPKVFSNKFNLDVFNNTFDSWKDTSSSQEIVEYREPEAMSSCDKMNYTDIDQSGKGNFTKVQEKNNDLTYCDLKNAYTTNSNLVNTSKINVKMYDNIDDYEHDRNNISYELTPEQIRQRELKKKQDDYLEQQRLIRIQQRDNIQEQHYNNLHQRMIGFRS